MTNPSDITIDPRAQGWIHLIWILAAGGLGFAVSGLFSGWLHLSRNLFLLAYLLVALPFLHLYLTWNGIQPIRLIRQNWRWGIAGAIVFSIIMIRGVKQQPPSPPPEGMLLLISLLWVGLIYGALDALFLSVMPVLAAWKAFETYGLGRRGRGRPIVWLTALGFSLFVTAAYHLGYPEYRGLTLIAPLIGNSIITVSFLLTSNPIAPISAHVVMHLAAILHGMESTFYLPPHG